MKHRGLSLCLGLLWLITSLALEAQEKPLRLDRSCPKADGLGKLVVLTNLPARGPGWRAVKKLADHRSARIFRFKANRVRSVAKKLRSLGPEFVALAVSPETVDMNFQLDMLELCRDLDHDPMPDFHFGYLCARDGDDLAAFVDRILAREVDEGAGVVAKVRPLTAPTEWIEKVDYLLHFGHGNPRRVIGGLTGEEVGALTLPRRPVVLSGACFTGVLSRSYHPWALKLVYGEPATIEPEQLLALNWVHAGVSGYIAALEGDRGEMAVAEWDHLRERAGALGEVVGYSYRLAFLSLYDEFTTFPRYVPGNRKLMSFYRVMLRGLVSRILISDPSFRPLRKPLDPPATEVTTRIDEDGARLVVTIRIRRPAQALFTDCFHMRKNGDFARRLSARVALPENLRARLGKPRVTLRRGERAIAFRRTRAKHEVWGGKRYANLQVESPDPQLGAPDCTATFSFPVIR